MLSTGLGRWRRVLEQLFPVRHLYVRSGGAVHGLTMTTGRQALLCIALTGGALWLGVATASMLLSALSAGPNEQQAIHTKAYYERLIADRQARLNSAVAQLSERGNSVEDLAQSIEKRHVALALLLTQVKGEPGMAAALTPQPLKAFSGRTPMDGVRAVKADQDRLIAQAETFAKSRADRLRLAFRLAGLDPAAFSKIGGEGLGGPLIEAKDPRALAAVLDVDSEFAERIQHAATDLSDTHTLSSQAQSLPLNRPTLNTRQASGFGVRVDPFNGRPAFHAGLDFAGAMMTPIHATAPGTVSFTGVRTGYGNTIEIDHGRGFKTRYAHLAAISVTVGQHVALGERIGGMGSTGRSTGPHLHYEVWVDGRPQNPQRFLEAGDYVQQAD
jgi:murein DD-endopeptidase MepM/ murein hydrolase activator NlpD